MYIFVFIYWNHIVVLLQIIRRITKKAREKKSDFVKTKRKNKIFQLFLAFDAFSGFQRNLTAQIKSVEENAWININPDSDEMEETKEEWNERRKKKKTKQKLRSVEQV